MSKRNRKQYATEEIVRGMVELFYRETPFQRRIRYHGLILLGRSRRVKGFRHPGIRSMVR